jgi:ribosomal protein L14E/L6E/L27E
MDFEIGHVVRSAAGHDRGDLFMIVGIEGDYLLLADGKTRRTEKPKRKKKSMHREGASAGPAALRLLKVKGPVIKKFRRALAAFAAGRQVKKEAKPLAKDDMIELEGVSSSRCPTQRSVWT